MIIEAYLSSFWPLGGGEVAVHSRHGKTAHTCARADTQPHVHTYVHANKVAF